MTEPQRLPLSENSLKKMNAELLTLPTICRSFPLPPSPEISRQNVVETFEQIFRGDTKVVFLEGPVNCGKTTVLSQFARRYSSETVSLFISASSKWGSDVEFIKADMCTQLHWAVRGEELKDLSKVSDAAIRDLLLQLKPVSRYKSKPFYFVVDGLEDLGQDHAQYRDLILDLIPLGLPNCCTIITGDAHTYPAHVRKLQHKTFPLTPFTPGETVLFLQDLVQIPSVIDDLHRLTKGLPGYLSSVRRILLSGTSATDLLQTLHDHLPEPFDVEWEKVTNCSHEELFALAVLSHDHRRHTVGDLTIISGMREDAVMSLVKAATFLNVQEQTGEIGFVSNSFRSFAAKKLASYRDQVNQTLIQLLLKTPDSETALTHLTSYLERAGREDDIVDYLSPARIQAVIQSAESCIPFQQKAELGLITAKHLKRDGDLLRFSLAKSAVAEVNRPQALRSEVEAHIALKNTSLALSLAQSARLKEDRLHLLAVVARELKTTKATVPAELIEQIKQLYSQLDIQLLGERSLEMANDLFFAAPSLAIDLVEKSRVHSHGGVADLTLARFSLMANLDVDRDPMQSSAEEIRNRIKDPRVRGLSQAVKLLVGDYSAEKLLAEVQQIERVAEQIYLLREWTQANAQAADAGTIVSFTLDLILRTAEYTPDARVFRQIAAPLPHMADRVLVMELIARIDTQLPTIEKVGPTAEYIRLRITLARAMYRWDKANARQRLVDLYLDISQLTHIKSRALSFTRLAAALKDLDAELDLEKSDKLHSLTRLSRDEELNKLLDTSADHHKAMKGIIRVLARYDFDHAISLAKSLNTESRRDAIFSDIVETVAEQNVSEQMIENIKATLLLFADRDVRDNALTKVSVALFHKKEIPAIFVEKILALASVSRLMASAADRAETSARFLLILKKTGAVGFEKEQDYLRTSAIDAWRFIDVGWAKIDSGFKLVNLLSREFEDFARAILKEIESVRSSTELEGGATAMSILQCLRLTIRSMRGLLPKGLFTDQDLRRLGQLISQLPSNLIRAQLWSEVAVRLFICGDQSRGKNIVVAELRPLLEQFEQGDLWSRDTAIVDSACVLYCAHKDIAFEWLDKLQPADRDIALRNISAFILQKCPPSDSCEETPQQGYKILYDDVVDLCSLMNRLNWDSAIYGTLKRIADTMCSKAYGARFTRAQKPDITKRLRDIIKTKLPVPTNIAHEGYVILAEAQIARIEDARGGVWNDLIIRAEKVPNTADRAFCLTALASIIPKREHQKRLTALQKAQQYASLIPIDSDRGEHFEALASAAIEIDPTITKQVLTEAAKSLRLSDEEAASEQQKSIIDFAHRYDPELASSLVAILDDDPARKTGQPTMAKEELRLLKLREEMVSEKEQPAVSRDQLRQYCEAARKLLSQLNSGRVGTVHVDRIRDYLELAATAPLDEVYPLFTWLVENLRCRHENTDQAQTILRPVFEALISTSEVMVWFAGRAWDVQKIRCGVTAPLENSIVFRWEERERVIKIIEDWVKGNVGDYLKICDPYFTPDELDFLKILRREKPDCDVSILCSKRENDFHSGLAAETVFRNHWRIHVSDQNAGDTTIVLIGVRGTGLFPIHDRVWLTNGAGLRIGTSLNALGVSRVSEISTMSSDESRQWELELDKFLFQRQRDYKGQKIEYSMFTL